MTVLGTMGCRQILGIDSASVGGDATVEDASADAELTDAMPLDSMIDSAPMGWTNIAPVSGFAAGDQDPTLTGDMLELFFSRGSDIYYSTRATESSAWGTPMPAPFAMAAIDTSPEITPDGLVLLFGSDRGAGMRLDIYFTARASRMGSWTSPDAIATINHTSFDELPGSVNVDASRITLSSDRNGMGTDLYESIRMGALGTPYYPPVRMPLSTSVDDGAPFLTSDGLTLYYASGPGGSRDLFVATRATLADSFTTGTRIDELNTPSNDSDPWVSPDGREIYFTSDRDGALRIWHASR